VALPAFLFEKGAAAPFVLAGIVGTSRLPNPEGKFSKSSLLSEYRRGHRPAALLRGPVHPPPATVQRGCAAADAGSIRLLDGDQKLAERDVRVLMPRVPLSSLV